MTYDPTIPTDLPPPNVAVNQIRTNFAQYAAGFNNNHVALNANNQGKHSNVLLQEQISDPTVSGSFDSLYSKSVTSNSSTSQEVFLTIPKFLPDKNNIPMQLTFNSVNTAGPIYQSFLPGGYLLFFGSIVQVPGPPITQTITLSPAPTEILCVIANPHNLLGTQQFFGIGVSVQVLNNFQFNISPSNNNLTIGNYTYTWVAIAKQ